MKTRIKEFRLAKDLTQAGLAERVTPPTTGEQIRKLETGERGLNFEWAAKIAAALGDGVRPLDLLDPHEAAKFAGPDSVGNLPSSDADYKGPPAEETDPEVVKAVLYPGKPKAFWMHVATEAMNMAGVLPGDFIIVDPDEPPRAGAIVVVQVYDEDTGSAETMLRAWCGGAVMMPRSTDVRFKALLYDEEATHIRVVGTVVRRFGDGVSEMDAKAA